MARPAADDQGNLDEGFDAMLLNRQRLQDILTEEGLDAVVLATPHNVIYGGEFASEFMLGGFEDFTSAVLLPRETGLEAGLVVPEFDLPYLVDAPSWIESIYAYGNPWSSVGMFMGETLEVSTDTPLRQRLKALRDRLRPSWQENFFDSVVALIQDRGLGGARLGCDDPRLAAALTAAGVGATDMPDVRQLMRRVRMVKFPAEVEILTEGAAINAAALEEVIAAGSKGVLESDLIRVYRQALTNRDCRFLGERGMMFGTGDASSFSLPADTPRHLEAGDAIVLDCLGMHRRYHMDLARTGVVGEPTKDQRHRHEAVVAALKAVEIECKPGAHTQELRGLVKRTIGGFGLKEELTSVTTHGLGLEVFEFPYEDSLKEGFTLEEGMVVNTEVFYRDEILGSFHPEDSVAVTASGCRWLHEVPRDLVIFS